MFINPVVVGVVSTLLVEAILLVVWAITRSGKKQTGGKMSGLACNLLILGTIGFFSIIGWLWKKTVKGEIDWDEIL